MKTINCVVYTRVSVDDEAVQTQEYNTLDNQRDSCLAYIQSQKANGWRFVKEYRDRGKSGGTLLRPALQAMLRDIRAGDITKVVVYKIDRLSRKHQDFYELLELFENHSVQFVSTTQQFDTGTPAGRLLLHIMAEFAQYEREMIQERTHEKRWAMAKRGMWTGGMIPIGYQLKDKKLIINPAEADIVQRIYLLYREHANLSVVAQMLNRQGLTTKRRTSTTGKMISGTRWDKKRVARILQNPIYIGVIRYTHPKDEGEYLYPGKHERIIADKQLWDATQKILGRNRELRKSYKKNKYELLFLGLIKCGNCGRVMTNTSRRKPSGKLYLYYKCPTVDDTGKSTCPSKLVSGSAIEGVLVRALSSLGGDRSLLEKSIRKANQGRSEGIGTLHEERRSLINRKSETKKKIDHLVEVLEQMADRKQLTSITNKIAELEATYTSIDQELTRVQSNIDLLQGRSIDQATYIRLFQRFSKVFADLSFDEQRNLVILLVREVIYRPNRVTVRFWGDLKEMDIPWINQNSHPLPSGKTPVVGWECRLTPRATLPNENLFHVCFPLFLCNVRRGEHRISLNHIAIPPTPSKGYPKGYPNPLLLAQQYKQLLDTPEIGSQTALARKVGVSRSRISQFLRLLKLPPDIQQSVIGMGDPLPSRAITERKLRALLTSPQPE